MNCALIIGRKGSTGFPGKNLLSVLGRPLASYCMMAASKSKYIDKTYISTDCEDLKEIANSYNIEFITRPDHLSGSEALGEDVYRHGYEVINKKMISEGNNIKTISLMMCNAPTITADLLDQGIEKLLENPEADSAVSVSVYNMWSPLRARKLGQDGFLKPFVPFDSFEGNPYKLSCDRDSQGNVYYADMGVSVVRPHCLENMNDGLLPQKWMGQKIIPIENWGGLDLDYAWQIGMVEFWLREHGFKYAGMNTG
jgi:CMP-N-acetylneuraminic acid synthetase